MSELELRADDGTSDVFEFRPFDQISLDRIEREWGISLTRLEIEGALQTVNSPREELAIRMRYQYGKKLREIAGDFLVSSNRISQVIKVGMGKLVRWKADPAAYLVKQPGNVPKPPSGASKGEMDVWIRQQYEAGYPIARIAKAIGRTESPVKSSLKRTNASR